MKNQLISLTVILIIVGFNGCIEENNTKENISTLPLSGEVTITTDKSDFKQNEIINLTFFNGLNESVYYSPSEFSFMKMEEKVHLNGSYGFFLISTLKRSLDDVFVPRVEIKSGESLSFDWEPGWMNRPCWDNYKTDRVFRLLILYLLENQTGQTVYSNEFTIVPKDIIIDTDRTKYLPTKDINFTIFNNLNENIYLLKCKPLNGQEYVLIAQTEKKNGDNWQNVDATPVCEKRRLIEITSASEETFNLSYNLNSPGAYRLKVFIRLDCKDSIEKYGWDLEENHGENICGETLTVYSNEFTVEGYENILVETDKKQYVIGENISIKITNNLDNIIGVKDVYNGIEILINGSWENLWEYTGNNCSCDPTFFWGVYPELESWKNMTVIWNQKMWNYCDFSASFFDLENSTFVFAPEGTYRVFATVGNQDFTDMIYSNEFLIDSSYFPQEPKPTKYLSSEQLSINLIESNAWYDYSPSIEGEENRQKHISINIEIENNLSFDLDNLFIYKAEVIQNGEVIGDFIPIFQINENCSNKLDSEEFVDEIDLISGCKLNFNIRALRSLDNLSNFSSSSGHPIKVRFRFVNNEYYTDIYETSEMSIIAVG